MLFIAQRGWMEEADEWLAPQDAVAPGPPTVFGHVLVDVLEIDGLRGEAHDRDEPRQRPAPCRGMAVVTPSGQ